MERSARMSGDVYHVLPLAQPPDCEVRVPGSKSITNRALLIAALADGESTLDDALFSDDTHYMAQAWAPAGYHRDPGCGQRTIHRRRPWRHRGRRSRPISTSATPAPRCVFWWRRCASGTVTFASTASPGCGNGRFKICSMPLGSWRSGAE